MRRSPPRTAAAQSPCGSSSILPAASSASSTSRSATVTSCEESPVDIRVHIERLVLEGLPVPPGQRPLIQAALEAELANKLAASGPGADMLAGGAVPRLAAGTIHVELANKLAASGPGAAMPAGGAGPRLAAGPVRGPRVAGARAWSRQIAG